MNLKNSLIVLGVLILTAVLCFLSTSTDEVSTQRKVPDVKWCEAGKKPVDVDVEDACANKDSAKGESQGEVLSSSENGDTNVPLTEEEKREAAETALVDEFDSLTDKWMDPVKDGVSMKSVTEFAEKFRKLPKSRKEECLQRALNLVPDENVMLLAGILMDKTMEKDYIELVFNDVLNRDESVKKPIMRQIFKDRTHPCWADTAWILDVTGELPKDK